MREKKSGNLDRKSFGKNGLSIPTDTEETYHLLQRGVHSNQDLNMVCKIGLYLGFEPIVGGSDFTLMVPRKIHTRRRYLSFHIVP